MSVLDKDRRNFLLGTEPGGAAFGESLLLPPRIEFVGASGVCAHSGVMSVRALIIKAAG